MSMRGAGLLAGAVTATLAAAPALLSAQSGDATRVLADLRNAIGGADKLAAIRSVVAVGTIQRVTPRGTVENSQEVTLQLPDKYVARNQVVNQGSMSVYRITGFNGDGLINETDAPPNLNAGLGDRVDRPQVPPTADQQAENNRRLLLTFKKDFARMMLGMFGLSSEAFPLQFSYAGEAESADGVAHMIEARGADNFTARLFVDIRTSLPLMLTWTTGEAPKTVEHRTYYADFKEVNGVSLPHTLQQSLDGKLIAETTFTEIRFNPKIGGRTFAISK